jgi:mannose-6-phosphate isomerase-like protein (cupin superfamily)
MADPGDTISQPNGVRLTFVRTAGSTGDRALELEWHVPAGGRLVALPHRHPDAPEHFRIVQGTGRHWVGRRRLLARAGDEWVVPANTSHVHPANTGGEPLVVRQWIELDAPDPQLIGGVERYFETVFALAQQGRVDRFGRIKDPLQDALTLWETLVPGSYLAGVPVPLQRALFRPLAALARRRGRQAVLAPAVTGAPEAARHRAASS